MASLEDVWVQQRRAAEAVRTAILRARAERAGRTVPAAPVLRQAG
ncbi:hypothetical protein ACFQ67_21130 [Streptomyces sp. NPDC056488]